MKNQLKKNAVISVFFLALLSAVILTAHQHRKEINIPKWERCLKITQKNRDPRVLIDCMVDVDERQLRFQLYVPCQNETQRRELSEKKPRIRHRMIHVLTRDEAGMAVKRQDLKALKKQLLVAVNAVLKKPVKTVYYDYYFFN